MLLYRFISHEEYEVLMRGEKVTPIKDWSDNKNNSFSEEGVFFFSGAEHRKVFAPFCYDDREYMVIVDAIPVASGTGLYKMQAGSKSVLLREYLLKEYSCQQVLSISKIFETDKICWGNYYGLEEEELVALRNSGGRVVTK